MWGQSHMSVGATSSTVGMLVHQQDSFIVSVQGTYDQVQWQSGGHVHMYRNVHIQTAQLASLSLLIFYTCALW